MASTLHGQSACRQSSLYDAALDATDYYNVTEGSGEINPAGLPYGFFHHQLEGRHEP